MIFNDNKNFNKEITLLKQISKEVLSASEKEKLQALLINQLVQNTFVAQGNTFFHSSKIRYIATTLAGLGLIGGTVFASNDSRPGDILFPVKKASEQVQITFSVSAQSKAELKTKIAEKRLKDLETVAPKNKVRAEQEAESEANNALQALQRVQDDLESKGNVQAAESVSARIDKFKEQAAQHEVKVKPTQKTKKENKDQKKIDKSLEKSKNSEQSGEVKGANSSKGGKKDNSKD